MTLAAAAREVGEPFARAVLCFQLLSWELPPALAAAEEPECMVDGLALQPLVADAAPGLKGGVRRQRDKHTLDERAGLVDGIGLRVGQGGCVHYGQTYEFSGLQDATSPDEREHYFAVAADLLERRLGPGGEPLGGSLAESLRTGAKSLPQWIEAAASARTGAPVHVWGECSEARCSTGFACGDATCTVEVAPAGKGRVTLTVIYDFPL